MSHEDGRAVLVTGAASGIGSACVEAFARRGDRVVAVDIDGDGLDRLAALPAVMAKAVHPVVGDVADPDAVERAVEECRRRYGGIDVLVNNAGYVPTGRVHEINVADWSRCLSVNLTSQFLMARLCVPHMVGRSGPAIVNVSSSSGKRAAPGTGGYAAAKHAVIGLTQSLALDVAGLGIRVNAVCPARVDTPLAAGQRKVLAEQRAVSEQAVQDAWDAEIPMGRVARPAEVADAILWLAGPESSYVTGESVNVSGGLILW